MTEFARISPFVLGLAASVAILACGGGGLTLPTEGEPAAIATVKGDGQSDRVGAVLAESLVVQVTDSRGRPVAGAQVQFSSGAPGAQVAPELATTDADGLGSTQAMLGTQVGSQSVRALVVGAAEDRNLAATFTLSGLPATANKIRVVGGGDDQQGAVGTKLPAPLVVAVTDAFGNPVRDVPIAWTAGGGGSVSPTSTATGPDGRASVERTLGSTAGPQTTVARSDGLAGSPLTFTHTATAGNAAGVTIVSGNNQTGTPRSQLAADLIVRVADASGNPISGRAVQWVIGQGGGSPSPTSSSTDGSGQAFTRWTLGPSPGTNTLSAVVSGVGVAEFTANAALVVPPALSMVQQPSGTADNGVPFARQPIVQLHDATGNPSPTPNVTVTASVAGATLGGTVTRPTDNTGKATFTDLSITGSAGASYRLTFAAAGFVSVTSAPIVLGAGAPTQLAINGGNNQQATAGTVVGTDPSVKVSDASGNPVAGVTVTFVAAPGSGSVTGASQPTDGSGIATVGSWTLGANPGPNTLTASAAGLPAVTFTATGTARVADASRSTATVPAGTAGAPTTIAVQAKDATGTNLATGGATVVVTVAGANPTGPITATDNGNGTYTAGYTPIKSGTDMVTITLNGAALGGSPYTSAVAAGPASASTSTAAVPAGTAGSATTITIQLRDANDNNRTSGEGPAAVVVSVAGANAGSPVGVTDNGNGTYAATYTPAVAGEDQITITLNGTGISGSPYSSTVS